MQGDDDGAEKYRYCVLSDQLVIVMDQFNSSLKRVLQRRLEDLLPWYNEEQLLRMCADILAGLNYLHNEGIAHRDLKVREMILELTPQDRQHPGHFVRDKRGSVVARHRLWDFEADRVSEQLHNLERWHS